MCRSQWVIWLVVSGLAYAYGNPCDRNKVYNCYLYIVYYETAVIPLFGQNEEDLNQTCRKMYLSLACVAQYYEMCKNSSQCDDNCKSQIAKIALFISVSGLSNLVEELCYESSMVRKIYLDNAMCLKENADLYASCHSIALRSRQYTLTLQRTYSLEERCCFFSWFHDCFTNITRDNCGKNATYFVEFAVNKLIGVKMYEVCFGTPSKCTGPLLPPEKSNITTEANHFTTTKIDITTEGIDTTTEEIDITTGESDMTKGESVITTEDDVRDNKIDVTSKSAPVQYCTVNLISLSCLYILLSEYVRNLSLYN